MGCTEYYNFPLSNPCTAEELRCYFNSLLKDIDCKLHEVQMICSNPNSSQVECIVRELTELRYKVIAVTNTQCAQELRLKCALDRGNENQLDILKLEEKLRVAVIDIDNAVLNVNKAVSTVEQIEEKFEGVVQTVESYDERLTASEQSIVENENSITQNALSIDTLNRILDTQGDAVQKNSEDISEIKDNITQIYENTTNLENELAVLDVTVEGIEQQLDTTKRTLSSLQSDFNADQGKIESLEENYGRLSTDVVGLRADVNELINNQGSGGADLGDIPERLTKAEEDITALDSKINTTNEGIDTVVRQQILTNLNNIQKNAGDIQILQSNDTSANNKISTLESYVSELQTYSEEHSSSIDSITETVNRLSEEQSAQGGEISDLLSASAALYTNIEQLQTKTTDIENSVEAANLTVNDLNIKYDGLADEVDIIKKTVINKQTGITGNSSLVYKNNSSAGSVAYAAISYTITPTKIKTNNSVIMVMDYIGTIEEVTPVNNATTVLSIPVLKLADLGITEDVMVLSVDVHPLEFTNGNYKYFATPMPINYSGEERISVDVRITSLTTGAVDVAVSAPKNFKVRVVINTIRR